MFRKQNVRKDRYVTIVQFAIMSAIAYLSLSVLCVMGLGTGVEFFISLVTVV